MFNCGQVNITSNMFQKINFTILKIQCKEEILYFNSLKMMDNCLKLMMAKILLLILNIKDY